MLMPHAIFSSPQIAGVGYTEQELEREGRNKNIEYSKSVYSYIGTCNGTSTSRQGWFC